MNLTLIRPNIIGDIKATVLPPTELSCSACARNLAVCDCTADELAAATKPHVCTDCGARERTLIGDQCFPCAGFAEHARTPEVAA